MCLSSLIILSHPTENYRIMSEGLWSKQTTQNQMRQSGSASTAELKEIASLCADDNLMIEKARHGTPLPKYYSDDN